ncbi:MAG TPA: NifU family protein, partial [Rhodospirillales bacterium]|nr:NifU family protein [Rhodospirillales bacterium]
MFIQTERTPNPATLKFMPGVPVMESRTANFTAATEATNSPLATGLFGIEGVTGVFLGADFITATKSDDKDWDIMKPLILGAIMEHFQSGKAAIEGDSPDTDTVDSSAPEPTGGIEMQIKE